MNLASALEHAAAPDPRIAVAEARLVMLREVAEFGVTRIRERYARPGEDPVIACGRFSRAIRCALILESIIEVELAALQAGTWTPAPEPKPAKDKDMSAPKDPVERESPDRETFGHILKLPFKDALKWICKELGMDGDEFLRTHPLAPLACSDPVPAPTPAPAPAPAAAPTPASTSSEEVRDGIRARVVEAINAELVIDEEVDTAEVDLAVRNLDARVYSTRRYDAVIQPPQIDAVSAILSDLGLDPRPTREAFPPPDPPPRMTRAP